MGGWNACSHLSFVYYSIHDFSRIDNLKSIYRKRTDLRKLHLHFYHLSAVKLYQLLRREKPNDTPTTVLYTLIQISGACDMCEELHTPPFRFRVSIPEEAFKFNAEVALDLVWLDRNPVLHVGDLQTGYQNA